MDVTVILETSLIGDFLDVEGENVVSRGKAQPWKRPRSAEMENRALPL